MPHFFSCVHCKEFILKSEGIYRHLHRKGEIFDVNKRFSIICRAGILKNNTKEIIAMIWQDYLKKIGLYIHFHRIGEIFDVNKPFSIICRAGMTK